MSDVKNTIVNGKAVLGIEFGSTRIKAVLASRQESPPFVLPGHYS